MHVSFAESSRHKNTPQQYKAIYIKHLDKGRIINNGFNAGNKQRDLIRNYFQRAPFKCATRLESSARVLN